MKTNLIFTFYKIHIFEVDFVMKYVGIHTGYQMRKSREYGNITTIHSMAMASKYPDIMDAKKKLNCLYCHLCSQKAQNVLSVNEQQLTDFQPKTSQAQS